MATKRGESKRKRSREETRLKTDLPFEEAIKRLLNTPPPDREASQLPPKDVRRPRKVSQTRKEPA